MAFYHNLIIWSIKQHVFIFALTCDSKIAILFMSISNACVLPFQIGCDLNINSIKHTVICFGHLLNWTIVDNPAFSEMFDNINVDE